MPRKKKESDKKKGWGSVCFFCGKEIKRTAISDGCYIKEEDEKNYPVTVFNIPGYVHRRCRGEYKKNLVENPLEITDLSNFLGE